MNKKTVIGWEIVMVMLVLAVYGGCFYFGMREHLALILASGVVFAVFVLTIPISELSLMRATNLIVASLAATFATIGTAYGAVVVVPQAEVFAIAISVFAATFSILAVIADCGKIRGLWVLASLLGESAAIFAGVIAINRFIG